MFDLAIMGGGGGVLKHYIPIGIEFLKGKFPVLNKGVDEVVKEGTLKAKNFFNKIFGGGSSTNEIVGSSTGTELVPSNVSLKNVSGNLDEASSAARIQPHGPTTTIARRLPQNFEEYLALDEAKSGAGQVIIKSLSDPRYQGWEKIQHIHRCLDGRNIVIHYIRNPKTGYITDFKFK